MSEKPFVPLDAIMEIVLPALSMLCQDGSFKVGGERREDGQARGNVWKLWHCASFSVARWTPRRVHNKWLNPYISTSSVLLPTAPPPQIRRSVASGCLQVVEAVLKDSDLGPESGLEAGLCGPVARLFLTLCSDQASRSSSEGVQEAITHFTLLLGICFLL